MIGEGIPSCGESLNKVIEIGTLPASLENNKLRKHMDD